jgi:glycosyltransferase 2 family protein
MKRRLSVLSLLTVACLAAVAWGLDLGSAWAALASYEQLWLIPMVATMVASFAARVWRFQALLDEPLSGRQHASVMAVSVLAIMVVPLRMGEAVRPWLLVDRYRVPLGSALAAVLVERVLDVLGLAGLLAVTALVVDPSQTIDLGGVDLIAVGRKAIGATAILGIGGVLASAVIGTRVIQAVATITARASPLAATRIRSVGNRFVRGTSLLVSEPRRGAQAVLATVLTWTLSVTYCAIAMQGMPGLEPTLSTVLANWSAIVVAIVVMPTPAYIGAFEVASVGALTLLGSTKSVATAFALGFHAAVLAFSSCLGIAALMWEGWSLSELVGHSSKLAVDGD